MIGNSALPHTWAEPRLLFFLLLIAIAVTVISVSCRRKPTPQKNTEAAERLRAHLAEGRPYKFFIGMPLGAPTEWIEAQPNGFNLSCRGKTVDLAELGSFLVVYPNGEVLNAERVFFPLPPGIRFVSGAADRKNDALDVGSLDEGRRLASITYGRSASRPNEPGHYSTTIQNISTNKIRVKKFGFFAASANGFRLKTISGDYFTGDEFVSWYGTPSDGWIPAGESVSDPNNYSGSDGYWVYYFEGEDGRQFAAGAQVPR